MANSMMQPVAHDPFYTIAAPNFLQMGAMAQQQQAFFLLQQQQMMVGVQQSHSFANPYGDVLYAPVVPVQASNAFHGLI